MRNDDLISVIIPVYNNEKFILNIIEDLKNQSYKNDEFIFVNDGSSDSSAELINEAAKTDSRIVLENKLNGGAASARNTGIGAASGKYIAFVDADDRLDRFYIEKLHDAISENDADIALLSVSWIYPDGRETKELNEDKTYTIDEYIRALIDAEIQHITAYGPCCKLISTDILKKNSILFPEEYALSEDRIFNAVLLRYIKTVAVSSYVGYFYIQNGASLTHNRTAFTTVQNIIKAESAFWNAFEQALLEKNMLQENYKWVCVQRRNAFFAMEHYIYDSDANRRQKHIMYNMLHSVISPEQFAMGSDKGIKTKIWVYLLKMKSYYILRAMLWAMRKIQILKGNRNKLSRI